MLPQQFKKNYLTQQMAMKIGRQLERNEYHFDGFDTASEFERKCYYWLREAEIKHMKRLRAYIELEEDLNSKY